MRISRWGVMLALFLIVLIVCGISLRNNLFERHKSVRLSAQRNDEPSAILRFTKNLTEPAILVLLPKSINDTQGTVISSITDAQYCGDAAGVGRVLVQITRIADAPAAANLRLADCSSTLDSVVARHRNDKGFSGVLDMRLSWSPWALSRSVNTAYPVSNTTFSPSQLASLSHFSDSLPTQDILISAPGGTNEHFAFAVGFSPDAIFAGFFQSSGPPAADWERQSYPATPINIPTADIQIGVAHTLLSQLASKYPNGFTYPNQIDGASVTLSNPLEMPLSEAGGQNTGIRLQADVHLSNISFCTTTLTTDWYGVPLKFASATARTKDSGICKGLAAAIQNQIQQSLNGVQLSSRSTKDFNIVVGGRQFSAHFSTDFSMADIDYLSMFGNGSLDAQ